MAPHIGGQDSEGNLYIFWSGCYSGFAKADLFGQKISLNGELLWEKGGRKILEGGQFISLPSRIRNDTIFLVYKDPVYSLDSYQNLNAIAIDTSGRYCWEAPLVLNSEQTYKNYLSLSDIVDGQGVVCFGSHDRWGNSSGQIKLQNFWVDGSLGSKNTFIQDNMIATSNAKIWYIPDQNVIKVINCESLRRCSLFDLYGHLIKSISVENTPNNKFTFSCHEIPNGIYIVKVTSDACVYTQMLYLY